jgi:hypothetical protein
MDKCSFFLCIHVIRNVISRAAFQISNRKIKGFIQPVCPVRKDSPEQFIRLNFPRLLHHAQILHQIPDFFHGVSVPEQCHHRCLQQFSPSCTGEYGILTDPFVFYMNFRRHP